MKIAITRQDSFSDFNSPGALPWSAFFDYLSSEGHKIVSLKCKPDLIIFMNHHKSGMFSALEFKRALKVLVLWESSVTRPSNYKQSNLDNYNFIFTPSSKWISGENVFTFHWPQGIRSQSTRNEVGFHLRDSRTIVLQNNKFSFVDGEMYTLRRNIIKVFGENLVVHGKGWSSLGSTLRGLLNASKNFPIFYGNFRFSNQSNLWIQPRNYRGIALDKITELEKYKFTIVVENSRDYLSEKLIESLWAGCCVFYVGPPLLDFGIPLVAIECPPDADEIKRKYDEVSSELSLVDPYLANARSFLSSKNFKAMRNDLVLAKLAADILNQVKTITECKE